MTKSLHSGPVVRWPGTAHATPAAGSRCEERHAWRTSPRHADASASPQWAIDEDRPPGDKPYHRDVAAIAWRQMRHSRLQAEAAVGVPRLGSVCGGADHPMRTAWGTPSDICVPAPA